MAKYDPFFLVYDDSNSFSSIFMVCDNMDIGGRYQKQGCKLQGKGQGFNNLEGIIIVKGTKASSC